MVRSRSGVRPCEMSKRERCLELIVALFQTLDRVIHLIESGLKKKKTRLNWVIK